MKHIPLWNRPIYPVILNSEKSNLKKDTFHHTLLSAPKKHPNSTQYPNSNHLHLLSNQHHQRHYLDERKIEERIEPPPPNTSRLFYAGSGSMDELGTSILVFVKCLYMCAMVNWKVAQVVPFELAHFGGGELWREWMIMDAPEAPHPLVRQRFWKSVKKLYMWDSWPLNNKNGEWMDSRSVPPVLIQCLTIMNGWIMDEFYMACLYQCVIIMNSIQNFGCKNLWSRCVFCNML